MTSSVRRWVSGVGLAGGAAVAAAMIGGAATTPTARADDGSLATDIGLLTTAETDVNDGLTALTQLSGGSAPPGNLGVLIGDYEAVQTPLLSSDNSFLSGLGEALFNGPDQQLAQSSEAFLSAAGAYAADPTSVTNTVDVLSSTFQWTDSLLFDSVPDNAIGKLVDQVFDVGGYDTASAGAATDLATSAASTSATPDDVIGQTLAAASSGNEYDPAVFDYSQDPSNLFSPVYTIEPIGPEDVSVTSSATGDVYGTQDFEVSSLGIPVDTFTGNVEYSPVSSVLDEFGNPYAEVITVAGSPGTVLPENTAFIVGEYGFGFGNVFEGSMNTAGTTATVGDFLLTPFGDWNISPIVDLFTSYLDTTSTAAAVDPSIFTDLLSSIGL